MDILDRISVDKILNIIIKTRSKIMVDHQVNATDVDIAKAIEEELTQENAKLKEQLARVDVKKIKRMLQIQLLPEVIRTESAMWLKNNVGMVAQAIVTMIKGVDDEERMGKNE